MPDFMPLAPANGGDLLLMLIGVLVADLVLGLVPGTRALVPVSARVFTAIAMFFERRLNRAGRGAVTLIVRGILVLLIVVGLAVGFGFAVMAAAKFPYGWVLGAVVLLLCVGGRDVALTLRRGLQFIAADDISASRELATRLSGRDASRLDRFGIGRVAIETAAVGFSRRVIAPVFWFILLGFPGLLVWRAVSRLARTAMNRERNAQAFGAAALALDHALGLIPSYIAGYLLAFGAVISPGAACRRGLHFMSLDAQRDAVVNDGRVKGAVAGALGLALVSALLLLHA